MLETAVDGVSNFCIVSWRSMGLGENIQRSDLGSPGASRALSSTPSLPACASFPSTNGTCPETAPIPLRIITQRYLPGGASESGRMPERFNHSGIEISILLPLLNLCFRRTRDYNILLLTYREIRCRS